MYKKLYFVIDACWMVIVNGVTNHIAVGEQVRMSFNLQLCARWLRGAIIRLLPFEKSLSSTCFQEFTWVECKMYLNGFKLCLTFLRKYISNWNIHVFYSIFSMSICNFEIGFHKNGNTTFINIRAVKVLCMFFVSLLFSIKQISSCCHPI